LSANLRSRNAFAVERSDLLKRLSGAAAWRAPSPGLGGWGLLLVAVTGSAAAAIVGYLVSRNPSATPAHLAVALRVTLILSLLVTGMMMSRGQPRMAAVLVGAGFFTCVWLLNGSTDRLSFSLGELAAGFAPAVLSFLILSHPTGTLRSRREQRFVLYAGGALAVFWTLFVVSSAAPFAAPLVGRGHPNDVFSLISLGSTGATAVKIGIWGSWTVLACGTPVLVSYAIRTASPRLRRAWVPLELASWANAACFLAFLGARVSGSSASGALGAVYVASALAIPTAMLVRLGLERSLMGAALARFVDGLAMHPHADLQALLAGALDDPSLVIARPTPGHDAYVDASGAPVALPNHDPARAVTWIEPAHGPVTAVIYDARIADRWAFVHAASVAAGIRLDAERLEAELDTSTTQLAASRLRLLEAADAERRRIERDLHDGVQQQVVGLRLKLDLASQALKEDQARGERMLEILGRNLDELLGTLRSLAKGIYPTVLKERGLRAAISSVALTMPVPVSVAAGGVHRYREDIEVAVYFCCVEALQNVIKHAGPGAHVTVRSWEKNGSLWLTVQDSGSGFELEDAGRGSGLVNMRDRIEAVGGRLWVVARPNGGTVVRARVPASTVTQP
jgi:signal transduction histidine kinase